LLWSGGMRKQYTIGFCCVPLNCLVPWKFSLLPLVLVWRTDIPLHPLRTVLANGRYWFSCELIDASIRQFCNFWTLHSHTIPCLVVWGFHPLNLVTVAIAPEFRPILTARLLQYQGQYPELAEIHSPQYAQWNMLQFKSTSSECCSLNLLNLSHKFRGPGLVLVRWAHDALYVAFCPVEGGQGSGDMKNRTPCSHVPCLISGTEEAVVCCERCDAQMN
jgi:hypothetical protein